jgi:hypothetical protein
MARSSVWKSLFLEQLRLTGNVSEAASVAGIARDTVYKARKSSERFAEQWDEAIEQACDRMEREAFRRAVEGTDKPVFYQGSECGAIREYSDTLLIFLLKAHRPDKYRERSSVELTGKNGEPVVIKYVNHWRDNQGD